MDINNFKVLEKDEESNKKVKLYYDCLEIKEAGEYDEDVGTHLINKKIIEYVYEVDRDDIECYLYYELGVDEEDINNNFDKVLQDNMSAILNEYEFEARNQAEEMW